jgi:hypothetical protein
MRRMRRAPRAPATNPNVIISGAHGPEQIAQIVQNILIKRVRIGFCADEPRNLARIPNRVAFPALAREKTNKVPKVLRIARELNEPAEHDRLCHTQYQLPDR